MSESSIQRREDRRELQQEISKLRSRVEKLTKAIESTLDYIDGVHNSECDTYSMCSNCSISFELIAAKDSEETDDNR